MQAGREVSGLPGGTDAELEPAACGVNRQAPKQRLRAFTLLLGLRIRCFSAKEKALTLAKSVKIGEEQGR